MDPFSSLMLACVMGHFVGDYLLQNNWMALNKGEDAGVCAIHVSIYTFAIFIFLFFEIGFCANLGVILAITWITHFIQDHFNVVGYWTRLVGGRDLKEYCNDDSEIDRVTVLHGGFTSLVYTVCDNTYHMLWFYIPLKLLFGI